MPEKVSDSEMPKALRPPAPNHILWDVVPRPLTYPLRGRLLCWLFWRCWLNPCMWVLRVVAPRHNPYRHLVAVFVADPASALEVAREASPRVADDRK